MKEFFYFPFFYLINSRLKTKFELISWQIIFFIPGLIITYYYLDIRSNIFIHLFLLSQIMFYCIYETGYIENDVVTVKTEKNPTLRLNKENFKYIKKNYSKIIFSRYLIFSLSFILLLWIDIWIEYVLNMKIFLFFLIITRIIFFIHNKIRNRFTILTFFLLSISKFIFPLVLFVDLDKIHYALLLSVVTFPILRTIEILLLKRYKIKSIGKIITDIDIFRTVYYFILFILVISVYFLDFIEIYELYIGVTLALYFLIFRLICLFLIKGGVYNRDRKVKTKFQNKFK